MFRTRTKTVGLPPGMLHRAGAGPATAARVHVMDYGELVCEENAFDSVHDAIAWQPSGSVRWVHVEGVDDLDTIAALGEHFHLHGLLQEDIANLDARPRVEDFGEHLYISLSVLGISETRGKVEASILKLVVGQGILLTFQERGEDQLEPIRERIRKSRGRVRLREADYLAYAMIDLVVDHYFLVLEDLGNRLEQIDQVITERPSSNLLKAIYLAKRELSMLRRAVWPVRDLTSELRRIETPLLADETEVFLRDVYDHVIQVIDIVEAYRDLVSGMLDLHLSTVSNRMNEVMKVLTIIATIFMPLGFLAGLYGMNFQNMPELALPWAYPTLLGLMLVVAVGMVLFFRRKKWL